MASERQTAANRANARKSKGPTSDSGKKRSSRNSYRHGLSVSLLVRSEAHFKDMTRQFAEGATEGEIFELARRAAEAQLDLERIRRVQAAMMGHTLPASDEEKERPFQDVETALAGLVKTIAYEKRAAGRRDRAISRIASIKQRRIR